MENCSENKMTAIAVTLSAAKGLFCRGGKRSLRQAQGRLFAPLRITSTCVLEIGAFHASRDEPNAHGDSGAEDHSMTTSSASMMFRAYPDRFQFCSARCV